MIPSRLQPYSSMKHSRVKWLGDLPRHWRVLPNRAAYQEVKQRDHPTERMLSVTMKRGVIAQQTLLSTSNKKDSSNLDKSAYKLVCPGDIVYNKMRAWQGAIAASELRGIVSPAYVVQRPKDGVEPRYVHRLFRIPAFASEAERWSYGITSDMWSLRPEHFKLIFGCHPPIEEQRAIVRYLDHADRRIQRYIHAKERLIELLEEQKQAIIHQAVTGQIDVRTGQPYPAYKDSGVEWLGEVPEHWEVRRLRNVGEAIIGLTYAPQDVGDEGDGILVLRASNVSQGHIVDADNVFVRCSIPDRLITRVGDILICSRSGSKALIGKNARIDSASSGVTFGAFMTIFRCKNSDYLHFVFNSRLFEYQSGAFLTSTINQLTLGMLYRIKVPLPPPETQERIILYLVEATGALDKAIARSRRQTELLRQYRTRLIADVVTGKLDVREAAASLPETDPITAADPTATPDPQAPTQADIPTPAPHPHP